MYYFVIKIDSKTVIRKSLHTSYLTFAIIIKLKILNRLSNMGISDKGFITVLGSNNLNLVAENETEEKLLKEIEKTVVNKIKRLGKNHNVNIDTFFLHLLLIHPLKHLNTINKNYFDTIPILQLF